MKYRILITTYKSGRVSYRAQVRIKSFFIYSWMDIASDATLYDIKIELSNRSHAIQYIDNHYSGNQIIKSIEIEYINR